MLYRNRCVLASGAVIDEVVWKLPHPDAQRPHGYKYRLYYGRGGRRVVGYDNERGKGDHRHYGNREEHYAFSSIEQLLTDFRADVLRAESKR